MLLDRASPNQAGSPLTLSSDELGLVIPVGGLSTIDLSESTESAASGKAITVSVKARSAGGKGDFAVVYFTNDVGNSGMKTFTASEAFTDFIFEYSVPEMVKGNGDALKFNSDVDRDGFGIEVSEVKIAVE